MSNTILGIDLGSNSIGWALLSADIKDRPNGLIDAGVRIFPKAVEEKTPTPKNAKRRERRLARRVVQRRARRKQRMLNYLISLKLLPETLKDHPQPEIILNELGDPYQLRAKALDEKLTAYELGRILLHLVQRRGFLSNKKTLLGSEMLDDPDVQQVLVELGDDNPDVAGTDSEETAFKKDISELRDRISSSDCRTLGEYLASLSEEDCKRNRSHNGGHLRTDRKMYRDELHAVWEKQAEYHLILTEDVRFQLEEIIFHQRPLKLKKDRVGKCSLEKSNKRCQIARLEYQRFRYLQDINNLRYIDPYTDAEKSLTEEDRDKLVHLFENKATPTFGAIRKELGLKGIQFNLENSLKKLKGNTTACEIRQVFSGWDNLPDEQQQALVEDLLTIRKKTALKKRLMDHWVIDGKTAVLLCMAEFEPGYGNHSMKAVNKLLPFLKQGMVYSDTRVEAGYGYEQEGIEHVDRLGAPPEIPNPIVSKGLHELRRVVNALIAEYGKPDVIRIEMARDLEMNTKRYKAFRKQQDDNTKANNKATEEYQAVASRNPALELSKYPSKTDKIKYRLWSDQGGRCAYSNKPINMTDLFSANIEIDHILPFSQSLDDSYMNKVVCVAAENRYKGNRTPKDAFAGNGDKWDQITSAIHRWDRKKLKSKIDRFYKTGAELVKRDFIGSQLTDTRYISREAGLYLKTLGVDITYTRGIMTDWLRHHWNLNTLIGEADKKERTDHRHHAIDAVVTACIDRRFYQVLAANAKSLGEKRTGLTMHDLITDSPWPELRTEIADRLETLIISHTSQRKITGALHEETGVGFIDGVGTVYRKNLNSDFTLKNAQSILDPVVKEQVIKHLKAHNNKPKQAFAEGVVVFHKNAKTPIKRVRVMQSDTTREKLEKSKLGVRNKQGNVFRWMTYGNMHHVEIIRHKKSGKYEGIFVTAMEAAHRARGINGLKRPIIQKDHGENVEFVIALHINDTVSLDKDGKQQLYRVKKLGQLNQGRNPRPTLSPVNSADERGIFSDSVKNLMEKNSMKLHRINAIGKLQHDQTNC